MAGKAMTKTQVLSNLAESTGLSKGQIEDVSVQSGHCLAAS
ncbi:MAG: hypothetical protein Ct9H300mP1_14690 [Planctomycetaceae bacterium]|nr:MAG: hypothetical protein Ct9H300mP1_14690 [Planctomycetaceae bacterium]